MAVNLTSGAISMIVTGKCTWKNLHPVVQLTGIANEVTHSIDNKKWRWVTLSDGYFFQIGLIAHQFFISNQLHKGSIVQLTKFHYTIVAAIGSESYILVSDLNLLPTKCDIIGHPKRYLVNETPFVVSRTTPAIPDVEEPPTLKQKQVHVIDVDDDVVEPPTLKQKQDHVEQDPLTSTQKCSSHSPTQHKKRKLQSSDDIFSGFGKGMSKFVSVTVEKTIEDRLGSCYKKLGTLEEGVSKMTRMMMVKNKEVDMGFKKLETLEKDVSKMAKSMIDKNKEDDVGACFKKLETLEKDVSKLTRMMMNKNKEDDVGACYKKLETLEEDVSRMTRMIMEKNKEDVVGFNKLEILEVEDVSKMKETKMEKNKEDDMGACIEKLDKMGWGAEEPIYDTALLLFLKGDDYRKLWLHLKPERCGKWLKTAGSIFGLLD